MKMMKTCIVVGTMLCVSHHARAQQANVNLDWNPHKNVQNLNPYGANVISPEVRDDRTVTFRLKAADARTVALTGGPILLAVVKGTAPIPFEKSGDRQRNSADAIREERGRRVDTDRRPVEAEPLCIPAARGRRRHCRSE